MKKFICSICDYVHEGDSVPEMCPICKVPSRYFESFVGEQILKQISTDESFINAMIELKEKDPIEYQLKLQQFKTQLEQQKQSKQPKEKSKPNQSKCPHCSSTNISSISTVERVGSIVFWGMFSKKINKSFKCNSCGYTW